MRLTRQVRGVREDKEKKLSKMAVRFTDMPTCVDCHRPRDPMIKGYDDKWRCMSCNRVHGEAVLRESGDSSPNESENRPGRPAVPALGEQERRQARVTKMLEKYGITKLNRDWV